MSMGCLEKSSEFSFWQVYGFDTLQGRLHLSDSLAFTQNACPLILRDRNFGLMGTILSTTLCLEFVFHLRQISFVAGMRVCLKQLLNPWLSWNTFYRYPFPCSWSVGSVETCYHAQERFFEVQLYCFVLFVCFFCLFFQVRVSSLTVLELTL